MRRFLRLAASLAPLAFAAPAWAAPARMQDYDQTLTRVQWSQAPSYRAVVDAYPAKARLARVGGRVTLMCQLSWDERPTGCDVLSERPARYGFAAAAKALAAHFVGPLSDRASDSLAGAYTVISFDFSPAMLDSDAPVIGDPEWTRVPRSLGAAQSFPAAARAAHVETGHVGLACTVAAGGRLEQCSVTREEPLGLGFGAAALAAAPEFRVSVWTDAGMPTVGGRVAVPLLYRAAAAGAP